jgi:hypothetical protein
MFFISKLPRKIDVFVENMLIVKKNGIEGKTVRSEP